MSTPWQQMSDSLPASSSACPSPASTCPSQRLLIDANFSLLPSQLHVDVNDTVPNIAKNAVS